MSLILSDGNRLYADKRSSGIVKIDKRDAMKTRKHLDIHHDKSVKLIDLSENGVHYKGQRVMAMGAAGTIDPKYPDFVDVIDQMKSVELYLKLANNNSFTGDKQSIILLMGNGDTILLDRYFREIPRARRTSVSRHPKGEIVGCGSGYTVISKFPLAMERCSVRDLFLYACYITPSCSLSYSTYLLSSGTLIETIEPSEESVIRAISRVQPYLGFVGPKSERS